MTICRSKASVVTNTCQVGKGLDHNKVAPASCFCKWPIHTGLVSTGSIKLYYYCNIYGCLAVVLRPLNFSYGNDIFCEKLLDFKSPLSFRDKFSNGFFHFPKDGMEMNSEMNLQSLQLPSKTHETYEFRHVQCATAVKIHAGMQATHLESGITVGAEAESYDQKFVPKHKL